MIFFDLSVNLSSPALPITIFSIVPSSLVLATVLNSSISITPSDLADNSAWSAILEAVPPTWNVLSVNCVPGSPIDCAAITPTASPFWTNFPVAKFLP